MTRPTPPRLIADDRVSSLLLVGSVWLASRVAMAGVLVVQSAHQHLPVTQVLHQWDVWHFLAIAGHGYANPMDVAFFPGLPALLAAGARLGIAMPVTGVLLALVASALAAWALTRIGGPVAACLWLLAPTAIFTAVPYTEALFCAAAFWAWWFATEDRWLAAAACAGLACTFRVSGLFLIGALAVLAITQIWGKDGWVGGLLRRWAWLLVPMAVLGGYELYLHALTGSWRAWFDAQQTGWERGFTNPLAAFRHTWAAGDPARWINRPEVAWVFRAEIVSMALGLGTTVWCFVKRRWAEAAFVGIQVVAFGTSYWYMSVNRATLAWFPLFIMLAGLVTWRPVNPRARRVWWAVVAVALVAEAALMLVWSWLFLTGRWAS